MIPEEQIQSIEAIVTKLSAAKVFNMGAIKNGSLYVMVNSGLLYVLKIPVPEEIHYFFCENIRIPLNPLLKYMIDPIMQMMYDVDSCNGLNYTNLKLVYDNPEILMDEKFQEILASKANDGSFRYYFPIDGGNTFIYLTKNMFNLNKGDGLEFKVYKTGDLRYIARFIIHKKKTKQDIELYFSFLDMVQRRMICQ